MPGIRSSDLLIQSQAVAIVSDGRTFLEWRQGQIPYVGWHAILCNPPQGALAGGSKP